MRTPRRLRPAGTALIVAGSLLAGCVSSNGRTQVDATVPGLGLGTTPGGPTGPDGDCTLIEVAVSPEKLDLMTQLAKDFNASDSAKNTAGQCLFVRVARKSSGAAAQLLINGWPEPETNGPQPTIWSPSASAWGAVVNVRTNSTIAPPGTSFMLTPLVIAMPKPMAQALGYPGKKVGFADIVRLANDPEGWAAVGHPEWGRFKLGKTNPNFSTSGLNFTIAEYYAATGKQQGLTIEDLNKADVKQFVAGVESGVVHYGDTTLTFLNNWYRADSRGTALTYVSAAAVEEKSIIDYNSGNPDGILAAGEVLKPPKVPLVAVYPSEGTLFSDNPLIVLNAPWVTPEQRAGAAVFEQFVTSDENQAKVLASGFRPGTPAVAIAAPINAANGVDPNQPDAELVVPDPKVLAAVLDQWEANRKRARVLLVIDISGSMEDPAGNGESKLELAKRAAIKSIEQFKDDDEVGLWVFSSGLGPAEDQNYLELLPVQRIGGQKEALRNRINGLVPTNGTPLYDVAGAAHAAMKEGFDRAKINAVVLLTDGVNDDGTSSDDDDQRSALVNSLRASSEGASADDVRLFTISYGEDADKETLRRIAEATSAALYDASNPQTIEQVFTNVISNF